MTDQEFKGMQTMPVWLGVIIAFVIIFGFIAVMCMIVHDVDKSMEDKKQKGVII